MPLSFVLLLLRVTAILLIPIIMLNACTGGSDNRPDMAAGNSAVNISPEALSNPLDPVCGMDMRQIKIADTTWYNGRLYAFCNSACKEAFLADPAHYLK